MFVSEPAASMLPFAQYKKLEAETQNTEEANEEMYENGSGRNITSGENTNGIFSYKSQNQMPGLLASNMNISQNGINLIKSFEGLRTKAYKALSTEKYYTIGYGHYGSDVYEGMTITEAEAENLLRTDLQRYVRYVNTFLGKYNISINQNQFDALTSFTYNVGNVWANQNFSLKRYLISGINHYSADQITTAFRNWNKSGGNVIAGLTRRREAEAKLFLDGTSQVSCNCSESYAGDYTCTANGNLYIRSGHGTGYSKLGSIPHGATVSVSKADGNWAHVSYNGIQGYASMSYLQKKEQAHDPEGHMDSINGGVGSIYLRGWVFDRDAADRAVELHVYVGGPAGSPDAKWVKTGIMANARREDVDKAYGTGANHGIDVTLQVPLIGDYDVYVYAINTGGGENNPCIGRKRVTIDHEHNKPIISDVKVTADKTGYTVKCKVSDDSGIDRVQFPTWTKYNGQDDIIQGWGTAQSARGTYNKATGEVTYRVNRSSHNNESGQYITHIYAYDIYGNEGVAATGYTFDEKNEVTVSDMSGVKIGGRAKDALRINWNRNASASGYIIEQYSNGTWNRIARIGNGSTTTYRVENLKAATSYQFRIKGFAFAGSTAVYGNYQTVSGTTEEASLNLDNLTGVKIGGRADNALRLNWIKNTDASGYIIEQYSNGMWNRIARIGSGSTTTYRVENLKAGTSYQFRIKAFGFRGTEAVYGKTVSVSGKTNPAAVSGLAIGGTAKDALRLNWNRASGAEGYIIEKQEGTSWKRIARLEGGQTGTYRVEGLKAGTGYQFRIHAFGFDGNTAIYSEYKSVSGKTDAAAPAVTVGNMTGVKIGGRADNALRLNWDKNTSASGYIIEQSQNGTWTRIARIGSGSTITYRVENLKAGMSYQFRIRGFGFRGSNPVYGAFTYINGTTIPSKVSGFCIGGTASDAIRLNWNKNTSASGYIIEKYQNGSWIRIARIADRNVQTYRAEGLESQKSYIFRIHSFGFDGGTALYSEYQMITGNTK